MELTHWRLKGVNWPSTSSQRPINWERRGFTRLAAPASESCLANPCTSPSSALFSSSSVSISYSTHAHKQAHTHTHTHRQVQGDSHNNRTHHRNNISPRDSCNTLITIHAYTLINTRTHPLFQIHIQYHTTGIYITPHSQPLTQKKTLIIRNHL